MSYFLSSYVDEYGDTLYTPTTLGYVVSIVVIALLLLACCAIFGAKKKFTARPMAFAAMAIALAFATSNIKLIHMPMGGSVTLLSMFFITLIGYWYGLGTGIAAAVAYGVLQLIVDPYILTIPQMLVDYIFAFGALGLSGIFSKSKFKFNVITCYLIGVLGRYFFAFLSGWIFFGTYASYYGFNSGVVYSLAYNAAYIAPEVGITVAVLVIPPVRKALAYVKRLATGENDNKKVATKEA